MRLRVDVAASTTASRGRASLARGRQQAGGARALKGARDARPGVGVCGGALARRRRARGSRALRHLCAAERSVSGTRHECEWQGWARGRQAKRRCTVVGYRNTRTVPSSDVAHAEAVLMNPSAKLSRTSCRRRRTGAGGRAHAQGRESGPSCGAGGQPHDSRATRRAAKTPRRQRVRRARSAAGALPAGPSIAWVASSRTVPTYYS